MCPGDFTEDVEEEAGGVTRNVTMSSVIYSSTSYLVIFGDPLKAASSSENFVQSVLFHVLLVQFTTYSFRSWYPSN